MASADRPLDPGQSGGDPRTLVAGAAGVLDCSGASGAAGTMTGMRSPLALALVALLVAACGSATPSPSPSTSAAASIADVASPTPVPTAPASGEPPAPTIVPGGQTVEPGPAKTRVPTTQTDWGEILDAVPDDFPRYPGSKAAEPPPEPVSAAFTAAAGVDAVARWYREALAAAGYATLDLSDPLEDGSRVLDSQGDLPECQVQTTFTPAGESTVITVLFGAGCGGVRG